MTRSDVENGHPEHYQSIAEKLLKSTPNSFFANQFENKSNPQVHFETTGPEIWEQMEGNIDAFVAGVGTGGTISGVGRFLKSKNPNVRIVIADPVGSVVADAVNTGEYKYEGGSWSVEGIGEDYIPANLNLDIIDEGIYVSDKEAFEVLQIILKEEGILGGSSTGTLVAAAAKWCRKQKEHKNVVTFICDTGNKYLSKAFNKAWLQDNNLLDLKTYGDLRDLINRRADQGEMISVNETDSLLVAYNRMRASDVSQIPVMKGDKLVGILDEEDLLFAVSKDQSSFSNNVSDYMMDHLDTLKFDASKDELLSILTEGKVAIIFDGETFIGFVTKVDLINYYRNKFK